MEEVQKPTDRLNYTGELMPVIEGICDAYGVGKPISNSVIEVGYEDCNVIIETSQSRYLAKMFSKNRTPDEISRYTNMMQKVVEAGVHHPELLRTATGDVTYSNSGISLVLMQFIDGKTFYELNRAPTPIERKAVLEQAAKVNEIDYQPPYLFDSWAIPNIKTMFDRVKQYLQTDDLETVKRVMSGYEAIPVDNLPHSFVHGDFTKTNIMLDTNGQIHILDFSVANWYPRIQELAVIVANLLHDNSDTSSIQDKCKVVADEYGQYNALTDLERTHLPAYALAGMAMEFMGAHQEKYINGNDTDETAYWLTLGREGLRKALV
jgi:Ser/Thr protein kinase RdoA (MazF antagonist)